MRRVIALSAILAAAAGSAVAAGKPQPHRAAALDTARLERLTGAKGVLDAKADVFKVMAPRTDLAVEVAHVRVTPAMGLTSWAAFTPTGRGDMVMGDLVLTPDQVNPVMDVALDNGLEVTALHNHFMWDSPRVMFMHIGGMGDETELATAVGKVFAKIKATSGGAAGPPPADVDSANSTLDAVKLDGILHEKGVVTGGVYKVVVGRTTTMDGMRVGAAMGVNTWATFAGTEERAVVDGDFAMHEGELQGVLKALRGAGIDVVAIHQHMIEERPPIVFLHYWGVGRAEDLARGLRAALDRTAAGRG
jgi:hypothetical protein